MPIQQPSNQIKSVLSCGDQGFYADVKYRLTNVSIVRLKKGGKRFEVQCEYPLS